MSDVIQFPSQESLLEISVINELLQDLSEAFPGGSRAKNPTGMLRVFRQNLAGVSEAAARGAVKAIIRNDERFPSVSRLRAAAHEWTRRNVASPEYQLRHDANRCQSCTESFVITKRWRPAKDEKGRYVLTPDRRAAVLEDYTRDVCACHAPCRYTPDISLDAFDTYGVETMPVGLLPPIDQQRIQEQFGNTHTQWRRSTPPAEPIAETVQQIAAGASR